MINVFYTSTAQFFAIKMFDGVRDKITADTHENVKPIIDKYTKSKLQYLSLAIKRFIEFNVDGNWLSRFEEIILKKNDTNSLESFILRFGDEVGKIKFNERRTIGKYTKKEYVEKFGKDAWDSRQARIPKFSLESQILCYGQVEGTRRWEEMLSQKLRSGRKNYESRETPYKNGLTLVEFQERYGLLDGFSRWSNHCKRLSYVNSKQRYIDEYGLESGSEICRNIKSNLTIERFVELYGEHDGPRRLEISKSRTAITLDKMIVKYGEFEGAIRYELWRQTSAISGRYITNAPYSKSSQELFWKIYECLPDYLIPHVKFAELNGEEIIYIPENLNYTKRLILVDFKLKNVIIEFDGKYWHDVDSDKVRDEICNKMGYLVYRVDYGDYMKSKEFNVNQCLKFIYENTQH